MRAERLAGVDQATLRVGVDLGGTKIEAVALEGPHERGRLRIATPRDDYAATVEAIAGLVERLESAAGRPAGAGSGARRAAVGLGIPGTVVPETGLVKNANSTWLIGRPLQADVERRLGRPVRVANDANCFALSEATDGAGTGASVVFGVILGTGVGGGLVVHGQVLTGANGIAGEWGHNPLPWPEPDEWPGPSCYCGRTGCIETFLSGPGLAADHARHAGEPTGDPRGDALTAEVVVARAAAGDPAAEATLHRYEARLARALASVVNIVDPDVIVLGGGLSNVARLYARVPPLMHAWLFAADGSAPGRGPTTAASASTAPRPSTPLRPARHGDASGVRGAAWLAALE